MIRIIADSTCDISQKEAALLGIDIIPISVFFNEEEFLDGVTISHEEFYKKLAECEELPKTAQCTPHAFEESFEKYISQGDSIVGIFISSELSGTFNSARMAACEVAEKYNAEDKIFLIDSRIASIGTALLVREAVKMRDSGYDASDIAQKCNELVPHIRLYAEVATLKYLKMGGRLSSAEAFAGSLLQIKPIISFVDGKVIVAGKTRGKKAADAFIHAKLKEIPINTSYNFIFAHINCPDLLNDFMRITIPLVESDKSLINIGSIGCAVGTHIGPGAVGVAYIEQY